jgi:hypothetical protein
MLTALVLYTNPCRVEGIEPLTTAFGFTCTSVQVLILPQGRTLQHTASTNCMQHSQQFLSLLHFMQPRNLQFYCSTHNSQPLGLSCARFIGSQLPPAVFSMINFNSIVASTPSSKKGCIPIVFYNYKLACTWYFSYVSCMLVHHLINSVRVDELLQLKCSHSKIFIYFVQH